MLVPYLAGGIVLGWAIGFVVGSIISYLLALALRGIVKLVGMFRR
ncbi:hypothetical protein C7402_115239 [Paraburkholderia unamae]|uniref:Uncharacterized protein n=1 Tax=Paraburkholderia unamae TaxID=219649 RepID=A0ABX5KLE9_9BURK|nr:hypothetical protein C7402_115239 [Paraburkholderia unamae]